MTVAALNLSVEQPTLPRFDGSADPGDVANALRAEGAAIVENALTGREVKDLLDDLAPWFSLAPHSEGQFYGKMTRRFGGVFAKALSAARLPLHPIVLPTVESVLQNQNGEQIADMIDLSCAQGIGIGPGEAPQFMHRDEELWPFAKSYEVTAIVMWTLTDFTRENGATRIIPKSHLWPRDRAPQPGEAAYAEAPAGSAIIWLGGTLHGGGANSTGDYRLGVATAFKLGWLAPQEKLLVTTPASTARDFPERLQRLIGYQVHRPALGLIEGRDPLEWLKGQTGSVAAATDNLAPAHEAMLRDVNENPAAWIGYTT